MAKLNWEKRDKQDLMYKRSLTYNAVPPDPCNIDRPVDTTRTTAFNIRIGEPSPGPTQPPAEQRKPAPIPNPADFLGPGISFEKLIANVQPEILRLREDCSITDPVEISRKLNAAKFYAPNGASWNGQAIVILLELQDRAIRSDADIQAILDDEQPLSGKHEKLVRLSILRRILINGDQG